MKYFKSIIALICSLSLLCGMVPAVVFADTEMMAVEAEETPISDTLDLSSLTEEDILGEEESRREANVKHFKLIDGSMVAVSYPVAVHEEVNGEWEEIDNSLTSKIDAEGDVVQSTAAQNLRFSFVNGKGNRRLMKVEDTRSDARIVFELVDADKKELVLAEATDSDELFAVSGVVQKGTFVNILPDTDIEYIVAGTGLKENIVVKNADAVRELSFILHCKNVTASLKEDNSVVFTDTDGETVFTIPAPFMYDAARATSDAVAVTLEPHKKGYLYTMTPDTAWTSDPSRVYPITIDPVVESELDTDALRAAYIKESQPNSNFGGETLMWVGNVTSTAQCYSLVRAELPTLSAADYVTGVYYYMVPSPTIPEYEALFGWSAWNEQYLNGSMVMTAHALTASWTEGGVTWDNCPDYETSVLDAVRLTPDHKPSYTLQSNGRYSLNTEPILLNITEIGKSWYNGAENYGVLLKLNNEGNHVFAAEFFSDQGEWIASSQSVHPHAMVSYRSKAGLEDHFSYTSVSAGAAGTGYVQLNAGNLTFVQDGFSLGDAAASVTIKHVYNSCNSDIKTPYGYGWTLNYAQTLKEVELGNYTYYAYTDADATVHYFDVTEAADEYKDEENLGFTLNATKNQITDKHDTVWGFDENGRLSTLTEAHGDTITIEYTSQGGINSITDGLGRVYTFKYTNDMLESITSPDGRKAGYNYNASNLSSVFIRQNNETTDYLQYSYNGHLLKEACDHSGTLDDGTKTVAEITYRGTGEAARVEQLRHRTASGTALYTRAYTNIAYDLHHTTVTDQDGLAVTYQFDAYGLTRSVYNNHGHAQYFKHYAPNSQNPNGTSTYGVGKLEAASQIHYVVSNRILEHGFELIETPLQTPTNAKTYFEKWRGDTVRAENNPQEGLYCLELNSTDSTIPVSVYQEVPAHQFTGGKTYTLSAQICTSDTADSNSFFMSVVAGNTTLASLTLPCDTAWHREQLTFTLPANNASAVRVVFTKSGGGCGYVDSVQLEEKPTANRYNLLQNSDLSRFQTNPSKPFAWTFTTDGGTGAVTGSGGSDNALEALGLDAGHFRTAVSTANPARVFFDSTLSQTVVLGSQEKGSTLSYGGWMRVNPLPAPVGNEAVDTSKCGIRIELYDGTTLVQSAFIEANRYCEEWQFLGDVIVAKQAFSRAKVSFVYENNVNEARFDGAFLYADYFGQSFTYDDDGNVLSTTAYSDQKSTFEYTASDDLKTVVSPEGAAYTYTYNDFHDVKTGTSAEGVTYAYRYDENKNSDILGKVLSAQTVFGTARNDATVQYNFDDDKFLTSQKITDVRGNAVTQYYRTDGLLLKTEDAAGVVTEYTYDSRNRNTAVTASKGGTVLSTVSYVYDSANRLSEIRNGEVRYFFTYDAVGRVTRIAVGTSSDNAVTLSTTAYVDKAASNSYHSSQVAVRTYSNGDMVSYTYDELDRVVGERYEDETADHFVYTYDNEGCLTSVKDTVSGVTSYYEYDLSKRLSRSITTAVVDGEEQRQHILTYEYNAENALVGVTESFGGLEKATRYVYNKDNQITKATSPTGSVVLYDYSYDRRENRYVQVNLTENTATFGFAPQNATVTLMDSMATPVPTQKAVKLTRTASGEVSNEHALKLSSLFPTHRYAVAAWVRASEGASGTIDLSLRFSNTALSAQTQSFAIAGDNSEWKYIEALFTVPENVYGATADYVTPTLAWNSADAVGTVEVAGFTVTEEFEQLVVPGDLTVVDKTSGVTVTEVSDATAPLPSMPIRAWTKTGTASEGISLKASPLASSTPQPGDVWELTFYAKFVSGSQGDGFTFRFRGYNTTGTAMNRDVSDDAQIDLIEDDQWHRYTAYVTIADDAYAYGDEIYPHFGWRSSAANGTVHMNGVTVRKVGNQWNNTMPYLGFNPSSSTTELVEVSSANSPIAYQKTIRAAHNGTAYQYQISAPLSTFPQPTATDRWTLSFWAKTDGNNTVKLYKRTSNSGAPQSTALIKDNRWHYYAIPLSLGSGFDLSDIALYYSVAPQSELLLNGISLVPGDVPLATESDQNSAALKNKTIDTGTTKFNTAIEYDTDAERRAYSRVKHYINNGEAFSYSYDNAGNISSIQNPDGSYVTYTYDDLNQLVGEHYSTTVGDGSSGPHNAIAYTYDARGNILEKIYSLNGETVDTTTYTYGDTIWADRLTAFDGVAISYDEIGNPLNWTNGATLLWQHGRQLAGYTTADKTISYIYNDDGIRTSKTVNGVETTYNVVDGTLRRMTSGENTLEFINSTSVIFNGTEYWYVFNAQNDVIGLIDANGEYVVEYIYDAWGAPLSKTGILADTLGVLNPFRYRGYIYDEEAGWYYCQSRYYDPTVGRWLNADKYLTTGQGFVGSNMFAYCLNNPINYSDPTGAVCHIWDGGRSGPKCLFFPESDVCAYCNVKECCLPEGHASADELTSEQVHENAEIIYSMLSNEGMSTNAICAILGNMEVESGINPGQSEFGVGEAFGLVQWDPATKYTDWAYENGYSSSSLNGQVHYLVYSMKPGVGEWLEYDSSYYLSYSDFIVSTSSIDFLTQVFLWSYERPSAPHTERRVQAAYYWYDYFS